MSSLDGWIGQNIPDVIMDDAASWLVMLDSEDCAASDRIAFTRWLAEDPMHQWAFEELSAIWARLRTLSDMKRNADNSKVVWLPAPRKLPIHLAAENRIARWNGWSVLAASLLVISGIAVDIASRVPAEQFVTDQGETRNIELSDGSRVELNAQSTLNFSMDDNQRLLQMPEGEAVFHVAHDSRPFIVRVEHGTVAALGTIFSVDAGKDFFEVAVLEGQVSVSTGNLSPPLTEFDHDENYNFGQATATLSAGERFEITEEDPAYRISMASDIDQELAWRQGRVVIDNQPLNRVIRKMRRYSKTNVYIADAQLEELLVSGQFKIGDFERFLTQLSENYNITVDRSDRHWIILRASHQAG
jgi:transmembrane sensor